LPESLIVFTNQSHGIGPLRKRPLILPLVDLFVIDFGGAKFPLSYLKLSISNGISKYWFRR
jgi:hypothetical protein